MPASSISTVTTTARDIPTLTIYEDFDKIIAKEVCFTESGGTIVAGNHLMAKFHIFYVGTNLI